MRRPRDPPAAGLAQTRPNGAERGLVAPHDRRPSSERAAVMRVAVPRGRRNLGKRVVDEYPAMPRRVAAPGFGEQLAGPVDDRHRAGRNRRGSPLQQALRAAPGPHDAGTSQESRTSRPRCSESGLLVQHQGDDTGDVGTRSSCRS